MLSTLKKENNIITYDKGKKEMGGGKKSAARNRRSDQGYQPNNTTSQSTEKGTNEFSEIFKSNIGSLIVGVLVLAVWAIIHDLPNEVSDLKTSVAVINSRLDFLDSSYQYLNSRDFSYIMENVGAEEELQEETIAIVASTELKSGMISAQSSNENGIKTVIDMNEIDDTTVIGTNANNNEDVTKKDIENKTFITHYEENGEDIFLYGKFNEKNQWDGNCIINRYKGSKLTFIMDSEYNNGELLKYQQVFKGKNSLNQDIWYVSNREVQEEKNSGETWTYFVYGDFEKDFDIHTIKAKNILDVDKFLEITPPALEGYYSGYTSDGKYNDDSGNAYLVKYDVKGNVRYFYQGRISNGYGNDNGKDENKKSWAFIWGDADDGYHYHEGKFEDGHPKSTKKDWKYPVDKDFIESKINPDNYNCPLTRLID